MSQYSNQFQGGNGGFQGNNQQRQYDPNLDQVLYSTPENVISGRNNQNVFNIAIRSYNGTAPKIEFVRTFPGQNGQQGRKSIRLSYEEWQLLLKYGNEINQQLNGFMQQAQNAAPQGF